MGLDMYLDGEMYLYGDRAVHIEGIELPRIPDGSSRTDIMKVQEVTFRLAYWRKANQIHRWFVDNVQDGVDNCQPHYVSSEKLGELIVIVDRVLESRDEAVALSLLPPMEGFFFGAYEVGPYEDDNSIVWGYWQQLHETKRMLAAARHYDLYMVGQRETTNNQVYGKFFWGLSYTSSW